MTKLFLKTFWHDRHDRHETGYTGMTGMTGMPFSLWKNRPMPLMPVMPVLLKLLLFLMGGDIQPHPGKDTMSKLLEAAKRYLNHGLAVIPIWPDERKNPHLNSFTDYLTRLPSLAEWQRWASKWPTSNIGLITGYWLNYVGLDFDDLLTYDVWLKQWGQSPAAGHGQVSPITWQVKTRRGYHIWFQTRQEPGKSRIFVKDGLEVLLRARGGYCIVPPSIHHTGTPYKTVCNQLPCVVDNVDSILPGWKEKTDSQGQTVSDRALTIKPKKVKLENLIPPVKEHPNTRGAYLANCPFHEDSKPSAWINIDEQRFGCNACWPGLWWDVVNVYAMLKQISNGEAFKLLKGAI